MIQYQQAKNVLGKKCIAFEYDPKVSNHDLKTKCNIGRIIYVACDISFALGLIANAT